jgi:hypothetical protein
MNQHQEYRYKIHDIRVFRKDQTPFIVRLNLEGRLRMSSTCRSKESSYSFPGRSPCSSSPPTVCSDDKTTTGFREYHDNGGLEYIVRMQIATEQRKRALKWSWQHLSNWPRWQLQDLSKRLGCQTDRCFVEIECVPITSRCSTMSSWWCSSSSSILMPPRFWE